MDVAVEDEEKNYTEITKQVSSNVTSCMSSYTKVSIEIGFELESLRTSIHGVM